MIYSEVSCMMSFCPPHSGPLISFPPEARKGADGIEPLPTNTKTFVIFTFRITLYIFRIGNQPIKL